MNGNNGTQPSLQEPWCSGTERRRRLDTIRDEVTRLAATERLDGNGNRETVVSLLEMVLGIEPAPSVPTLPPKSTRIDVPETLSDHVSDRVLTYLRYQDEGKSMKQMAAHLHVGKVLLRASMARLVADGQIVKCGSRRSMRYEAAQRPAVVSRRTTYAPIPDEERKRLGRAIRAAREALGLSQDELASRLFVSGAALCRWERGSRLPDATRLYQLEVALELPENTLVSNLKPCLAIAVPTSHGELP